MAGHIRVRVTEAAGRRAVCYERSAMHPGGEARVKGVGTVHTVGETPTVLAGIRNGTLEIVPSRGRQAAAAEDTAADAGPAEGADAGTPEKAAADAEEADPALALPIPATLWESAGIAEVQGAKVLGDLPDATLALVARAMPRSQDERKFITAAKGRVTKSRAGRAKTRYTKPVAKPVKIN